MIDFIGSPSMIFMEVLTRPDGTGLECQEA